MTERFERLFVWTGGAMFVASLMFCAYSYVVTWAAPFRAPFVVIGGNNDEAGGGWTAFAFNAACCLCRLGRVDEGLEWLSKAVATGYTSPVPLDDDPDLDPLRSHPGFAALKEAAHKAG